jgi:hypothetical protein
MADVAVLSDTSEAMLDDCDVGVRIGEGKGEVKEGGDLAGPKVTEG